MAFGDGVNGSFIIEDTKGKRGSWGLSFPSNADVPAVTGNFMPSTAQLIDEVIDGKIVGANVSINVSLNGVTLKDAPMPNADVEEGAVFGFFSTAGAPTTFRIPTLDEQYGLDTGQSVDTSDPDIDALVQRIIEGDTQGLTTVRFADAHGNNVAGFKQAKDAFRKSRRK